MKRKSRREIAKEAAQAHTDLNIFYGVIALLEGGTVSSDAQPHDFRIIRICQQAGQKCLARYDRAIEALERIK